MEKPIAGVLVIIMISAAATTFNDDVKAKKCGFPLFKFVKSLCNGCYFRNSASHGL